VLEDFQTVSEGLFSEVRAGLQRVASCLAVERTNPLVVCSGRKEK